MGKEYIEEEELGDKVKGKIKLQSTINNGATKKMYF